MALFEAMDHHRRGGARSARDRRLHDDVAPVGRAISGSGECPRRALDQDDVPTPTGEPRIVGGGDTWVVMMPLRYPDAGDVHYVGVFELRDGLVRASTEFFGSPFPPKPERARFTDTA